MAHNPNDPLHNRVLRVQVGGGAQMSLPYRYWLHRLNYEKDKTPVGVCDDRVLAAGVLESYLYLVERCSKEEVWRRIQLMRAAILENPEYYDDGY